MASMSAHAWTICQAITNLPMFDRCICLMSSVLSRNTSCSAAFSTARLQRQRNMTHLYDFKIFHKGLFILVIDSFSNLQTVTTTRWPHGSLSAQYCHWFCSLMCRRLPLVICWDSLQKVDETIREKAILTFKYFKENQLETSVLYDKYKSCWSNHSVNPQLPIYSPVVLIDDTFHSYGVWLL